MHALHKLLLCHVLTCLGQNALAAKIIDGTKAPEGSMLYMASVQSNRHHICGGFLVSKDFVLTAAHCDKNGITVVLGTHNLNTDTVRMSIAKKCKHRSYRNVSTGNDLMLLKLSNDVPPDNRIQLIKLSSRNMQENKKCSVAGWGEIKTGGKAVAELRVVDVSVISQKVCKEKWCGLPANVICAGGYKTTKGFCQGDSGGPLVCDGKAVGVVSFNSGNCSYPNVYPNVYTNIPKFLPWIKKILKKKDC